MRIWVPMMFAVGAVITLACGGVGSSADDELVALPSPVPDAMVVDATGVGAPDPGTVTENVADVPAPRGSAVAITDAVTDKTDAPEPAPAPAPAPRPAATAPGQIQLTTGAAIQPMVDGVPMRLTESQGWMSEVSPGSHSLEIRNLLGNMTGSTTVTVRSGRRARYEWRRPNLTELSEVDSSPMPPELRVEDILGDIQPAPTPAPSGLDPKGGKK